MRKNFRLYILIPFAFLLLTACSQEVAVETSTVPPTVAAPTETYILQPQPLPPSLVVVLELPLGNLQQLQSVQPVLSELAASAGLQYESRQFLLEMCPRERRLSSFHRLATLRSCKTAFPCPIYHSQRTGFEPGARLMSSAFTLNRWASWLDISPKWW